MYEIYEGFYLDGVNTVHSLDFTHLFLENKHVFFAKSSCLLSFIVVVGVYLSYNIRGYDSRGAYMSTTLTIIFTSFTKVFLFLLLTRHDDSDNIVIL